MDPTFPDAIARRAWSMRYRRNETPLQAMLFGRAAVRRVHCPGALMRAKYRAASQVEA
jgi:hypothetical protein